MREREEEQERERGRERGGESEREYRREGREGREGERERLGRKQHTCIFDNPLKQPWDHIKFHLKMADVVYSCS